MTVLRARVVAVTDAEAIAALDDGTRATIALDDLPPVRRSVPGEEPRAGAAPGPDAAPGASGLPDLAGARVTGVVVAAPPGGPVRISPRALGLARCERAQAAGRRVRGRVVAARGDAALLDVGGVRALARGAACTGWVDAVSEQLVTLAPERRGARPSPTALTLVRSALVEWVYDAGAWVVLDDGSPAFVPRDEVGWAPLLSTVGILRPGDRVRGRVVGLTVDGPLLSPRAATPDPWTAVALELPAGCLVRVRVEQVAGGSALVRVLGVPPAAALVPVDATLRIGEVLDAAVEQVDEAARRLLLVLRPAEQP